MRNRTFLLWSLRWFGYLVESKIHMKMSVDSLVKRERHWEFARLLVTAFDAVCPTSHHRKIGFEGKLKNYASTSVHYGREVDLVSIKLRNTVHELVGRSGLLSFVSVGHSSHIVP
ncbi:hypothetical protein B0T13DRAFT_257427 [Neurospora crassa]|nr:hypothetical protein B0T13DRAFT_257427 [Neurospora crassa]